MKMTLIYPKWQKLERQTEFHLPPHGPVVFASEVPSEVDLTFIDENVQKITPNGNPDIVAISAMLTSQLPRAFEISRHYREHGIPVIFGGIATMLHSEEIINHADSVFLGEVEGRFAGVIDDFTHGKLKKFIPICPITQTFASLEMPGETSWIGPFIITVGSRCST